MALLELDDVKLHLHLEPEDTDEDAYLASLAAAAERACELHTNRFVDPTAIPEGSGIEALSAGDLDTLRHAARLLIGDWYRNREASVDAATAMLPTGVHWLLEPLKSYAGR